MALIETPGPVDGQPHLVDAVQDKPQGADGPLQNRGVANVKFIASICGESGRGHEKDGILLAF